MESSFKEYKDDNKSNDCLVPKTQKHTYECSKNNLVSDQSSPKSVNSFKEAMNNIKNSELPVYDAGKKKKESQENVEEIVVLPDIYQSDRLLTGVKNEINDSSAQKTKNEENETCRNNELKRAVCSITNATEHSLRNLPVKENDNIIIDSDLSQTDEVRNSSLLERIPIEMLNMCNFPQNNSLDYSSHMSGDAGSSKYCVKCNKIGNLTNHRCTAGYQYQCSICNKMFKHDKSLKCHMILHTGDSIFKCQFCGKTCAKNSTLLSHLQVHTNEKNYKCNYCSKIFKSNRSLKDHMAVHTGESFECKFCGKTYFHRTSLLCHLLVHNGEKVHRCSVCGKSFKAKGDLNVHLLIHSREKKHKCLVCGKCFTHSGTLNKHNLLHTEKRYECDICGKTFTQKGNLNTHLLVHINIKSFKCTTCEKTFLRKADLTTHALVHMTKHLYKCGICNQSLKRKKSLKKHMLKHM